MTRLPRFAVDPRGDATGAADFHSAANRRQRVCFLYIAQSHQILHTISVAVVLARCRPDIEVHIAATHDDGLSYAKSIVGELGGAPLRWKLLGPNWLRALHRRGEAPLKLPMLAANVAFLRGFDVLVTPERTTAVLRRWGFRFQKLVYTQHGAGDRAGPFEKRLGAFDLVFAAGAKQRDRMVNERLVAPSDCAVVGYPKFDAVEGLVRREQRLFAHKRPTVLYNPHFDGRLSSWPRWGAEILATFAEQSDFNLIFAPHLRLFEGRSATGVVALSPYRHHPGIHIDLGTRATVDMTYTTLADVYLGDVSSQVYEFIRRPRPCLFLNAHDAHWRDQESYAHWRFGPVTDSVDSLPCRVKAAQASHAAYAHDQIDGFSHTFDIGPTPSSNRAAAAIATLLAQRS